MTSTPQLTQLDLSPRRVTRWDQGKEIVIEGVCPAPFGSVRATAIEVAQRATGCHCADLYRVMSDGEIAYTLAVWSTIPNGQSSFADAFQAIRRGEILPWLYEDTLPEGYPYDDMFTQSRILDGVRMFPPV